MSYEIIIQGNCGPLNFKAVPVDIDRPSNKKIDKLIQDEWERLTRKKEKEGGKLYNGGLFRLISIQKDKSAPDVFILTVGPTTYREFVGTNLARIGRSGKFPREFLANPLGTSAIVTTTDNKILLGKRGSQVFYHRGYIHAFGGMLEEADKSEKGEINIFSSIQRELLEELGLYTSDILKIVCMGIVKDTAIQQPELLFDATCDLSHAEIEARWNLAPSRKEHSRLISIENSITGISDFLSMPRLIAPVAVAALHFRANRLKTIAGIS